MSAEGVRQILRHYAHFSKSVSGEESRQMLKALLRDLIATVSVVPTPLSSTTATPGTPSSGTQEPISVRPTFCAELSISAIRKGSTTSRPVMNYENFRCDGDAEVHNANRRTMSAVTSVVDTTPLGLWCSVFPWENNVGLSGVELKHFDPEPATLQQSRDTLKGMFFVHMDSSAALRRYWSGAILTPLDVLFLRGETNDSYGLRMLRPKQGYSNGPLEAVSTSFLEPFPQATDATAAAHLASQHPEKYAAVSSAGGVDAVLELSKGTIDAVMERALGGQFDHVNEFFAVDVVPGEQLTSEISEKRKLVTDMLPALEVRVSEAVNSLGHPDTPIDCELLALCHMSGLGNGRGTRWGSALGRVYNSLLASMENSSGQGEAEKPKVSIVHNGADDLGAATSAGGGDGEEKISDEQLQYLIHLCATPKWGFYEDFAADVKAAAEHRGMWPC